MSGARKEENDPLVVARALPGLELLDGEPKGALFELADAELAGAELAGGELEGADGCDRPPNCPGLEMSAGTSARISTSTVTAAFSPSSGSTDGDGVECRSEEGALMAVPGRNRAGASDSTSFKLPKRHYGFTADEFDCPMHLTIGGWS